MTRPDYIKCIADTHIDHKGLSLCGRNISFEFSFVDIDHAFHNGRNGGRLIACRECVSVATTGLMVGHTS